MKFTASLSDLKIYNEIHFGLEIKSARAEFRYYYAVVKNKEFLILHWELLRYDSLRSSEFFSQGVFMTTAAAADRAEGRWQRILIENS